MSSVDLNKNRGLRGVDVTKSEERHERESRELEGGKQSVGAAVAEEVAIVEGEIETTGRVSEVLGESISEDKGASITGGKAKAATPVSRDLRIKKLLEEAPAPSVMKAEIKKALDVEFRNIKKKVALAQKGGNFFEMTNLVARMRQIKGTLARLMRAPIKLIRELWIKIVHGEQI
ncbi:hypothetical protein CVV38_02925 [Candidatus Peregrinibacteria bacterium HGW-Peregrinibacteria-1]|jgi:hypothetical protein|nr:MAG: hypothetical protein CVV38_02925 [Candidatus Peregrinibacteria bacterium HGW-Peregrinibacteria-1]